MSHELRTPLNAIMGFAELLELDAEDGDQAESAARILAASRHLLWLIDEVLEISRIEAGALELNLRELNVASCVAEALELTEVHQPDPPLRVAVEVQPGASVVRGDAQRVRQVLVNLLSNAFKYNRPGGAVRVSASCAGDDIHVTVADSGLGIDPRRIPELFHPFHRLGAERSSVPGTGLGLSVAKRLAEAMDGDIVVESEPGIGSRFTLVLPRAAADRPAPTSEQLPRKASNAAA
jgi:signal transduction histidine kinase